MLSRSPMFRIEDKLTDAHAHTTTAIARFTSSVRLARRRVDPNA